MVKLIIDGNDVSEYVLEDNYKVNINSNGSAVSTGKSFRNWDGTMYYLDEAGGAAEMSPAKVVINAELAEVPEGFDLFGDGREQKIFEVEYSTPVSREGYFKCTSYSAEVDENDYDTDDDSVKTWGIKLTLESTAAPGSSSGGRL